MKEKHSWHQLVIAILILGLVMGFLAAGVALADFIKLSGTMPAFGDVEDFQISPDGQYVVYRADQDSDEVWELYSVPLSGGTPVKLNGTMPAGGDVDEDFEISADSSRVVYTADQDTDDVFELYSVPIGGPASARVKLNKELPALGDVLPWFQVSPDSSRVVYWADIETNQVHELYSVSITGPASAGIRLNGTMFPNTSVYPHSQISPDSSRVVYWADEESDDVWELYSVPIVGPANSGVKLNKTLVADGNVQDDYQISADSSRVVYRADQQTDLVFELYSVPIAGPASEGVKLNEALVVDGDVEDFRVSADSSRVVYRADKESDWVFELYSVPIAGPASEGTKLNGALVALGSVWNVYQISPDSSRVVYLADQESSVLGELYSVPIAGPASSGVKLNTAVELNGVGWFEISADSSRVVYWIDLDFELYSVPVAGPASAGVKLDETAAWIYRISADSSRVVYGDREDIYSVPIGGPASAGVKVNGPLVENGDVGSYEISPDSSRVVYIADQDIDEKEELYVADDGQILGPPANILFDEAHDERNTMDWTRAQEIASELGGQPDWYYYGDLVDALAAEYPFSRNTSAPLTYDLLKTYEGVILPVPRKSLTTGEISAIKKYVASGGGLVLIGDCGFEADHLYPRLHDTYGIEFNTQCLFSPKGSLEGNMEVSNFAGHLAVQGVVQFEMNWGQSLGFKDDAVLLAWTDDTVWEDTNWNQQYDEGTDVFGVNFPIVVGTDTACGRVVAVSDNSFHDDGFESRGNDTLMHALLNWVTDGTTCEVKDDNTLFLPLIIR